MTRAAQQTFHLNPKLDRELRSEWAFQFGSQKSIPARRASFDVALALDDCEVLRELIRARSASE